MNHILHKCKICGHEWNATPNRILNGTKCPKCSKNNRTKTHDVFCEELYSINNSMKILSKYKNAKTKLDCECKVCGNIWNTTPDVLLRGCGCPKCASDSTGYKNRMTHEDFIKQVYSLNQDITIIGTYNGVNNKISCKCNICNRIWDTTPAVLLQGCRCICCKTPQGEKCISTSLEKYDINYISQYKFCGLNGIGGKPLSYDFYLPKYNLLIEFQGEQHKRPIDWFGGEEKFKIQKEHDKRKRDYAKQNNINLLEIWYYDFDNIESILLQTINEIQENNLKLESVETTGVA